MRTIKDVLDHASKKKPREDKSEVSGRSKRTRHVNATWWMAVDDNGGRTSRVKLLHDPKKIARKRFMAFLCSLRSIVKHTKSRHHSDHQKVFKSDFLKRWPPIKKDRLNICILVDSNSF